MKKEYEIFKFPEDYRLAWSEEFKNPIDTDLWVISSAPRKGGYWSPEQVFIENERLIIRTEYKQKDKDSGFYSGGLHWRIKRSTYGYYEIRCRIENIRGAWSAFWLMPDLEDLYSKSGRAQDGCEIDIFESARSNRLQSTLHWNSYHSEKKHIVKAYDLYDGFHTFALDWKKDSLKFYYDNRLIWHIKNPSCISHRPASLCITTEVNGFQHRIPPKPCRFFWLGNGIITDRKNNLPYDFVIDYVRIYDNGQLKWSESESVIE